MNRARFKSRYAYRPMVRYDVFAGAEPKRANNKPHIIGEPERLEQLRLPEAKPPAMAREVVYVPYEESA